jgi:hypothetical protein
MKKVQQAVELVSTIIGLYVTMITTEGDKDCEAQSDRERLDHRISQFSVFNKKEYTVVKRAARLGIRHCVKY